MENNESMSSNSWSPKTTVGRWAGISALVAVLFLALGVIIGALDIKEDHFVRLVQGLVFVLSGVGALVLSALSLRQQDKSLVVWLALIVGVLIALLLLAEFTIME